ncbi:MAG: oligosaccharide flippase family protein [Gemmatimonadaceae bacterium]
MRAGTLLRSNLVDVLRPLARGAAWATIGTVFTQGSTLVSNIWIANLVGKVTFGEYAIVLATVQATAALASLGIGYTATRYIAEWRHRNVARAGQLLNLFDRLSWFAAITAAVLLAISASGIADAALRAPALGTSLMLAAASTVFTVRNGFLTGALMGLESFRALGIAGILSGSLYLALTAAGAAKDGVRGAVIGLLVSSALQCALLTFAVRRERNLQQLGTGSASFAKERPLLIRFALPAALSGVSSVPALWAVQALIARSHNSFGDLALYAAGLNMLTMIMFTPTVLNGVAMAWINRTQAVSGDAAYRSAIRTTLGVNLLTVVCALTGVAVLSPFILGLYGSGFRTGYLGLGLLLASSIPEAFTNALAQSLQTRERMWESFLLINIPRDIVLVCAAAYLIPRYGLTGAATAYITGRLVAACAMYLLVRDEMTPVRTTPAISQVVTE